MDALVVNCLYAPVKSLGECERGMKAGPEAVRPDPSHELAPSHRPPGRRGRAHRGPLPMVTVSVSKIVSGNTRSGLACCVEIP